jgi:hypothetical protein
MIFGTLAAAVSLASSSATHAAAFDVDCGGATNVDTNTPTVVGCSAAVSGTITDLNVVLNIDDASANPYATDLQITLVHVASGTTVNVYVGSEVANPTSIMDATFDDAAAGAPPGSGDIIGTFQAAQLLAAFNGLELSGSWVLQILDASPYPNEGIDLLSWHLNGTIVPEPGPVLLMTLGLLGLGIAGPNKPATRKPARPEADSSPRPPATMPPSP